LPVLLAHPSIAALVAISHHGGTKLGRSVDVVVAGAVDLDVDTQSIAPGQALAILRW
jgi:hypothetical protein